jgi:hypothetical protein
MWDLFFVGILVGIVVGVILDTIARVATCLGVVGCRRDRRVATPAVEVSW